MSKVLLHFLLYLYDIGMYAVKNKKGIISGKIWKTSRFMF